MSTPLLEVRRIHVAYGPVPVLRDVSLQAQQGEIVGVVGPNGSGKTTLLRTIQGLLRPLAGEIYFLGARVDGRAAYELIDLGVSCIPEGRRLFDDMSVRENLEVGAYAPRARDLVRDNLGRVFTMFPVLEAKADWPAARLSGGEQQMLALARGLMSRPRLLLMDDPFLGLGREVVPRFCEYLKGINHGGVTIVVAGQHVRRILSLASRAYLLEAGQITLEGRGEELLASAHLQAVLF
ncbi:MAG: ABC transporter ATP-binding protein [Deltaproteobacteria bacterium]|nr:ABC transporter ATP-binding protein [Deltaproteobacteria bacterium]